MEDRHMNPGTLCEIERSSLPARGWPFVRGGRKLGDEQSAIPVPHGGLRARPAERCAQRKHERKILVRFLVGNDAVSCRQQLGQGYQRWHPCAAGRKEGAAASPRIAKTESTQPGLIVHQGKEVDRGERSWGLALALGAGPLCTS